ncbi:hypothetical protein M9H77_23037 [Catharanthus roseus]|uniref:Uncharacterized protein n=1 Tax=Catharanthus roseus TaxID=4058 RepID=A0ACC0AS60_CATRO|nr:hypothetical protein M9H77_23037 [Catharanthus roseus]
MKNKSENGENEAIGTKEVCTVGQSTASGRSKGPQETSQNKPTTDSRIDLPHASPVRGPLLNDMLGRCTLDLDPIDRWRGTVGGLGPSRNQIWLVEQYGPLDSVILGSSTSSHEMMIYEDFGPHGLKPMYKF